MPKAVLGSIRGLDVPAQAQFGFTRIFDSEPRQTRAFVRARGER
jgi:hypothetical protein